MKVRRTGRSAAAVMIVALAAAAFGGGTSTASPAAGCSNSKVKAVAFFGFAAANSFAQATWKGVQQAAKACGASTKFFDPNFNSQTQVSQIQDAITTGQYQVFVVQANDGNAVVPAVRKLVMAAEQIDRLATLSVADWNAGLDAQIEALKAPAAAHG